MRMREKPLVSQVISDARAAGLMIYERRTVENGEPIGKPMVSRETNACDYLPRNATACER